MKYIIMCGGAYNQFEIPKHLTEVKGEKLVERTIRLLKENGVKDIAISTNNPAFDYINVEKLRHNNKYVYANKEKITSKNCWLNAYYPTEEPACYLYGDVYYSENAIKTIVNTEVKETMFFCVRDIHDGRKPGINTKGREPLAYKVQNQKIFRKAINELFEMIDKGYFTEEPVSWNLYRQINHKPLDYNGYGNGIFNSDGDYVVIDDYSTDIDNIKNVAKLERLIDILEGGVKMIKVEVIENFTLGKFNELINIERVSRKEPGKLYRGDKFTCTKDMADYLMGGNATGRSFVKVIEIIPEETKKEPIKEESVEEIKPDVQIKIESKKTISKPRKKKNK